MSFSLNFVFIVSALLHLICFRAYYTRHVKSICLHKQSLLIRNLGYVLQLKKIIIILHLIDTHFELQIVKCINDMKLFIEEIIQWIPQKFSFACFEVRGISEEEFGADWNLKHESDTTSHDAGVRISIGINNIEIVTKPDTHVLWTHKGVWIRMSLDRNLWQLTFLFKLPCKFQRSYSSCGLISKSRLCTALKILYFLFK